LVVVVGDGDLTESAKATWRRVRHEPSEKARDSRLFVAVNAHDYVNVHDNVHVEMGRFSRSGQQVAGVPQDV